MTIEDFFPKDRVYKKQNIERGRAKNPYQRNSVGSAESFALPKYINTLDPDLFDIVHLERKGAKRINKTRTAKVQVKGGILINPLHLLTIPVFFSFILWAYYTLNINTGLRAFEFVNEKSAYNAMHSYVFPESGSIEQASQPASVPASFRSVEYRTYTVGKGDTISGIAKKFGLRSIGTIFSANEISNARRIINGEKLIIPSMDGVMYTVKKGDSLSMISSKFGVAMEAILDVNDLSEQSVNIGQTLFIPGAALSSFDIRKAMGELFIYPIKGRLTSPFGYRADPFTGRRSFHSGIDLAAPEGTPIKVVLDGRVSEKGFSRVFGNYIIITHSGGYQSLYGHLSRFKVKRGQYVTQGGIIGLVGNTGLSTGPHVHLSIYKNGKLLNPLTVLAK